MPRVRSAFLIAAGLMLSAPAAAQSMPRATAQAFFDATGTKQWRAAAELVSTPSATEYQREQLRQILSMELNRRAVEGADGEAPAGEDVVADADPVAVRAAALEGGYDTVSLNLLPGVRAVGQLRRLAPAEFLARAMAAYEEADAFLRDKLQTPDPGPAIIIGEVVENDTAAYVVYRRTAFIGDDEGRLRVDEEFSVGLLHLRCQDGRWRVKLTSEFQPSLSLVHTHNRLGTDESAPNQNR